mmetsp:Transcript_31039/g.58430  ORF Transcript_31039/g.58430 Transcript_31039/m.58430 type:complete len:172 (+) Transcript_31039:153-668(+)
MLRPRECVPLLSRSCEPQQNIRQLGFSGWWDVDLAAYLQYPELFSAFVASYIGLIAVILHQTIRFYKVYKNQQDEAGRYQRTLFKFSFGTYAFGFLFLWVPENALCPLFPGVVQHFNMHALFHLCATIAPYNLLVFLIFHRMQVLRRQATHKFDAGCLVFIHVDNNNSKSM